MKQRKVLRNVPTYDLLSLSFSQRKMGIAALLMFKLGQNEIKGVDWAKRKMGIIQSLSLPPIFGTEMVPNKS